MKYGWTVLCACLWLDQPSKFLVLRGPEQWVSVARMWFERAGAVCVKIESPRRYGNSIGYALPQARVLSFGSFTLSHGL